VKKKSDDMFTRFDRMYERNRQTDINTHTHTHIDRQTDTA